MGNHHSKPLSRTFSRDYKRQSKSVKLRSSSSEESDTTTDKASDLYVRKLYTTDNSLPPSPTCSLPSTAHQRSEYNKSTETYLYHGRKYQNFNTKYILPNDELEQDRLTQVYIFGDNFSAPVRDLLSIKQSRRNSGGSYSQWLQDVPPPRVLDIACGNGTWILEMATEFPETQFYGIDLFANYPTTIKPANAFFCQSDVLQPQGLPYPDGYFDYIHMRQVYTCFSDDDWTIVMKEIKRLLKPGGYTELREIDPTLLNMGPIAQNFFLKFAKAMQEDHGVNILWARHMLEVLQNTGQMTDIHRQILPLRFSITGPIGNMTHTSFKLALDSFRPFFEKHNKISGSAYDTAVDTILHEAIQHDSYFNYYCCWGRKPFCDTEYHQPQHILDSRRYSSVAGRNSVVLTTSIPKQINNNSSNSSIKSYKSDDTTVATASIAAPMTKNSNKIIEEEEEEEEPAMPHWTNHACTTSANNSMSSFMFYPWEQDVVSLGVENMTDIHQFVEGYED
ncbi:MAG: S-adenosyl-L-methionine-dependent methyltransferase [Benjaminiella poitrasii]|nr:MAG: S-adenosyl-L-methionine-dependent methyltransferase [Benjaminiella poitrasii]